MDRLRDWINNRFSLCAGLVLLVALILKLATMGSAPLLDVTETRYATIAQQMILTGDWITPQMPTTQGLTWSLTPFLGKPPLAFWLMATSYNLFGCNEFSARFPNFVEGLLTLWLSFSIACRCFNKRTALLTVLILFSSVSFLIETGTVSMDLLVCLTVTGGIWALIASSQARTAETPVKKILYDALLGVFLGLGMLNKGPVCVVLFVGPLVLAALISRKLMWLRTPNWLVALAMASLVAVPGYLAVQRANPDFFEYFFLNENLYRYIKKDYGDRYGSGHHHPYGMSWLFSLLGFMPWAVLLIPMLRDWWKQVRTGKPAPVLQTAAEASCIVSSMPLLAGWALFAPLFFTFAKSIVFAYFCVSLPPLALLGARVVNQRANKQAWLLPLVLGVSFLIPLVVSGWYGFFAEAMVEKKSMKHIVQQLTEKQPDYAGMPTEFMEGQAQYSWFFYTLQKPVNAIISAHSVHTALITCSSTGGKHLVVVPVGQLKKFQRDHVSPHRPVAKSANYYIFEMQSSL